MICGNRRSGAVRILPEMIRRRLYCRTANSRGNRWSAPSGQGEAGGDGGVYWFMRFFVDVAQLSVDKDAFARALPLRGSCRCSLPKHSFRGTLVSRAMRVSGSDYPWGLPDYKGDRYATFPCPNAVAAAESHFMMSIHENFGQQEVSDISGSFR